MVGMNPVKSDRGNGMSNDNKGGQNRSIYIGGNATSSPATPGDNNTININFQPVSLPAPASVNIQAELNALREILAKLETEDRLIIDNAFIEAQHQLNKPQPDKNEVGKALERALDYAKKAEKFASAIKKLQPHLAKTTAWLGDNWHKLLSLVNLTI